MTDPKRTPVRAVRAVYPAHRSTIERLKREGRRIWSDPDFIWEQLIRSFSTMGNSRGARLITDPSLHDAVTYRAIAGLDANRRRAVLRKRSRAAPVRMAERKADWLCKNFRRIQRDGGLDTVKAALCGCLGRDAKIAFLLTFDGIGPKYARNILMDAYHREFRDSIAYDERLKRVAKALGLKFTRYEDAEQFFLEVADAADLSGWELDRLLYNAIEAILPEVLRHSGHNLQVVDRPSPRRYRECKA